MKNLILTITLILSVSIIAHGQKCKPKYTYKDDFTDEKIYLWGGQLTSMSVYSYNVKYIPTMYVYKKGDGYKIVMGIKVDGRLNNSMVLNNHTWFEKGSLIRFKLQNEVLEFIVEKGEVVQKTYGTSAEVTAPITIEQIKKLNSQRMIRAAVYPFKDNEDMIFQFKIPGARDKKIKKQLTCFLNRN